MIPELKKKLLERMFSSEEYYQRMMDYYEKGVTGAKEGLEWFESHYTGGDKDVLHSAHGWRVRVIPNMEGYLSSRDEDIESYRQGDTGPMEGTAFNIMSLQRNISQHMSEEWWDYVPEELQNKYFENIYKARKMASNIAWTLGEAWNDDEILRERITGPIDEQELLKYLKPGERP